MQATQSRAMVRLVLIAFVLMSGSVLTAQELTLTDDSSIEATQWLSMLKENVTFEEAVKSSNWNTVTGLAALGATDEPIWLRLKIKSEKATDRILQVDRLMLIQINVIVLSGGEKQIYDIGYDARLKGSGIRAPRPAVQVHLFPGESEIYFHVRSVASFAFPLVIYQPDAYHTSDQIPFLFHCCLFTALILMALYNFFIYLSTREASYRSYVLYVMSSLLFYFSVSALTMEFTPFLGTYWVVRINGVLAGLVNLTGIFFARSFLRTAENTPRIDKSMLIIGITAGVWGLLASMPFTKFSIMMTIMGFFGALSAFYMLVVSSYIWYRGYSPARFFTAAFFIWFLGVLVLSASTSGIVPSRHLSKYSMQVGSLTEMVLLSLALADRINALKHSLERKMKELEISEKKYRTLVEDTRDLIFTLDERWCFVTSNQASSGLLGYTPRAIQGKSFYELLYKMPGATEGIEEKLVQNWFAQLEKGPVEFRAHMLQKVGEPAELAFRMEKVGHGEEALIFGRASASLADGLLKFLNTEKGSYSIENYLTTSELVNRRITRILCRYFSQEDADSVEFCLREMLVNAIEHGNLEITYDEKTASQEDGSYLNLITNRQKLAPYRDRTVRVEYSLNRSRVWFRITDQGKGFDHVAMQGKESERLRDMKGSHGRGIALTRNLFDVVRYNRPGNQVTLIKLVQPDRK